MVEASAAEALAVAAEAPSEAVREESSAQRRTSPRTKLFRV